MKSKNIIAVIFIFLIYLFPFRYAVLSPTNSNILNTLFMVVTIVGTLIFMVVTMTDGKEEH